ncbi:response regulator [Paenibacillus hodogayensis]|uniref:Response regulator n=1 Tax=Paenibacillus hodogayensis TaxID=279208 RepID=A0ABV5VQZ3_9BACL
MLKILIVDDDKLVRKGLIVTMPWSDFGMTVVGEANNGEKALEFLQQHEVDLLITDLAMPVMPGIELMRRVRRLYPHLGIVVLTFHQDFESVQEALRIGAIDYIAKFELEKEQAEDVLGRIAERIRHERVRIDRHGNPFYDYENERDIYGASVDKPNHKRSSVPENDLLAIRVRWSSLLWVMNDKMFHELLAEMRLVRLSVSKLESMFDEAMTEWARLVPEKTLDPFNRIQTFAHWSDWEEWLQSVRKQIRLRLMKSYSAEVIQSVLKAVAFINRHLSEELRIADASKEAVMSRSYFSQCFKDIVGKPFHDYMRDARIANARVLLKQTSNPVYWVAEKCGYPNEKYFSRVFREQTGMLPSEFRLSKE